MNIKYLVGKQNVSNKPSVPFGIDECKFLDQLFLNLNTNDEANRFADIKALAFWCRKKNIEKLKKNFIDNNFRVGLGKLFHITPSNVPTNFFYSLIIGLLTGNSNIVKVPTKKFQQVEIICSAINKVLKKTPTIKNRIAVIRYNSSNTEITKKISSNCNGRLIWGGDKSVEDIKKNSTAIKSLDLVFPDRYSLALINAKSIIKLSKNEILRLSTSFYNDTYLNDQNACTSPHMILWTGSLIEIKKAKENFWNSLLIIVKKKYNLTNHISSEKLCHLYTLIAKNDNLGKLISYENLIFTFENTKITDKNHELRGKWGIFFESNIKSLDEVSPYINCKYQTLTYFGYEKKYFQNFILKMMPKGIDRIVPVGRSMDINLNWDGYDLKNILTRVIEIS